MTTPRRDAQRYVYAMIRFVPYPASGEFVNIGVLVGNDNARDWACERVADPSRAKSFGGEVLARAAFDFIDSFDASVQSRSRASQVDTWDEWLTEMRSNHRNFVQIGPAVPMRASSAAEATQMLLEICVGGSPSDIA